MKILLRGVDAEDPRWELEFLQLAHGLVMAGAKAKLIVRLTGLSQRKIRRLYRVLRGGPAPSGPIPHGRARDFVMASARKPMGWTIQCAIFLACYEKVGAFADVALHRGWQLLTAFQVYMSLTEELGQATPVSRLDINQAYGLLTHCGFLEDPKAELQRRACSTCLIHYLVIRSVPLRSQRCPICSIDANSRRLAGLRSKQEQARNSSFRAQSRHP